MGADARSRDLTGKDDGWEPAPAKVNLYLHVLGKRDDGYHELDSLVAFADLGDRLKFEPGSDWALTCRGPFAAALEGERDNLVLQAARAYAATARQTAPGIFTLEKNLPVASGLGGGSADAAAALRLLDRLNRGRDPAALKGIAQALGSDIPVCLAGRAAWMGGRGERVTPVVLPPLHAVLVNPGIAVSTPAIFASLAAASLQPQAVPTADLPSDATALIAWLRKQRNDLELPAARQQPAVAVCLDALLQTPNCLLARMSGSGATVFGCYETEAQAQAAASALADRHRGWWVRAATLG